MGSKSKGGNFERETAVALSLWWSKGERDDIFWRSQNSGGRSTMRGKRGKSTEGQYGDIAATDPSGKPLLAHWCIECKTGYASSKKSEILTEDGKKKTIKQIVNWCVLDIIDSRQNKSVIITLWEQAVNQAKENNTQPVLIFRRPRMSPCIAFHLNYFNHLTKIFDIPDCDRVIIRSDYSVVILSLDKFFFWIPDIRKAFK
jgi:hypothetical protein